jgi:hypothetical protein
MRRPLSLLLTYVAIVLTALACVLVSLPAHGQPVTFPLPACIDRPLLPVPAVSAPAGLPAQWGGSCSLTLESNSKGGAALLVCPQPSGPPRHNLYAVRWPAVTPAMMADAAMLGLPGDNAARVQAMLARYGTLHVLDMCDVWGHARDRFNSAYAAGVRPDAPPVAWVVARFGAQPTRPSFPVTNGTRGPASTVRAPVGAPCNCVAPLVEGSTTYCPWDAAGLVTSCTKGTP